MRVNLLPASALRRLTIRRQAWRWTAWVTAALVAACGVLATQYAELLSARHSAAALSAQCQELRALEKKIAQLRQQSASLKTTIASLERAQPEDHTLPLMGIVSQASKRLAGRLQLKHLSIQMAAQATGGPVSVTPVSAGRPAAAAPQPQVPAQPANDLVIEGTAENANTIAEFIEALRQTNVFSRADLTSTSDAASAAGQVRQFRVDCQF